MSSSEFQPQVCDVCFPEHPNGDRPLYTHSRDSERKSDKSKLALAGSADPAPTLCSGKVGLAPCL